MEEQWKILIEESSVGVSSGSTSGTASSAAGTDSAIKQIPKKQLTFFDQFGKYFKLFLPIIGTAGVMYALAKTSSVGAAFMEVIMGLLDALISTILAPLVPIFVALMPIFVALLPVIQLLATLLTPLADAIAKLLTWVINLGTAPPPMTKQQKAELDDSLSKLLDPNYNPSFYEILKDIWKNFWKMPIPPVPPPNTSSIIPKYDSTPNQGKSSGYTEINNTFNIDLQTSGNVDTLVNEIERKVKLSLNMAYRRV